MKIGFTSARWQQDIDGVWLCLKIERPNDGMAFLQEMKQGKRYDAELKEHKERRSLDANAYAWVLMDKLAAKTGIAKTDVYRSFIREIGGNNDVVCVLEPAVEKLRTNWSKNGIGWVTDVGPSKIAGCKTVTLYYGSSTYDTKQMSRLIDLIVQDCKEQGIETLTPFEIDALKERWSCTG